MADMSRLPAGGSPALLTLYELQRPFVEPLLQCCRLTNTAFDILFYDVGVLAAALLAKGLIVDTTAPANASARHPLASLDLCRDRGKLAVWLGIIHRARPLRALVKMPRVRSAPDRA